MKKLDDFHQKQLNKLRSIEEYREAAIFTILYDLMLDSEHGRGADKEELISIIEMIDEELKQGMDE